MAFGIKALADDGEHTMNARYMHVAVALWLVVLVAGGHAESYPSRPTVDDMTNIVALGTECIRGVNERCLATQTGTNSDGSGIYAVAPPFMQTNTIGWYLDTNAMGTMASTIKSLAPCYVDATSVHDGTTNISMLTFTGLLASLKLEGVFIGDGTNFTRTPAEYTSNNVATYSDHPDKIYIEDLQERYKVLNALKMTSAARTRSYHGSDMNQDWNRWEQDPSGYIFSNSATHAVIGPAYYPYQGAYVLGLENAFYESSYCSTNVPDNYWDQCAPYTWYVHNMSYEEYKTWHSWWYFYQWAYENPEQPPWHFYPDGYIEATNGVGLGAGTYFAVTKIPWDSEPGLHKRTWMWLEWERVTYATWEFQSVYTNQSLVNTWEIYLKPTLPDMPTQIWTNEVPGPVPGSILDWTYPQSWTVTVSAKFKELEGMPTNVYTKLNSSFVNESDGVLTVVFGSDEFPPLDAAASEPDYPSPPTEATAALDLVYNDNTGSVGTMKGSYVNPSDYFFVKTWQFNYCTNK